tara:strand:- start:71 stop:436 length:366 start_codon:yes stop_codon:yes gene_type:complete
MEKIEISPLDEWYESLKPGDLLTVTYNGNYRYFGVFLYTKGKYKTASGAYSDGLLRYHDIPPAEYEHHKWYYERLKDGIPSQSYILGNSVKQRVFPAQSWMLTNKQKEYYNKLKQKLGYEY